MKFFKKKMLLLAFLLCSISPAAVDAGCVICDGSENNNGWCRGRDVRACVDEPSWFASKCLIGATTLNDCPQLGM